MHNDIKNVVTPAQDYNISDVQVLEFIERVEKMATDSLSTSKIILEMTGHLKKIGLDLNPVMGSSCHSVELFSFCSPYGILDCRAE